jgi:hypothetical protein
MGRKPTEEEIATRMAASIYVREPAILGLPEPAEAACDLDDFDEEFDDDLDDTDE